MSNRDCRTTANWGQRLTFFSIITALVCTIGVFQNCSKKGSNNSGSNTPLGGYAPKNFKSEGFGFGDRAPASVQFLRSSHRVVASGLSDLDGDSLITGTFEAGGDKDVAVVRVGRDGLIQSAHTVGGDGQEEIRAQALAAGGRLLAVGNVRQNSAQGGFSRDGLVVVGDGSGLSMKSLSAGVVTGLSAITSDNGTFVAGFTSDSPRGDIKSPLIAQLDDNQNVAWSRRLKGVESGEFLAITDSGDQVVAVGYSNRSNFGRVSALIARFAKDGEFLSATEMSLGDTTQALAVAGTDDGGLVIGGSVTASGNERGFIAKISADNRLQWARLAQEESRIQSVKSAGGDIVAVGSGTLANGNRNVVAIRLATNGVPKSQSILGGELSSFFSGQALAIGADGQARVAFNSTAAGGSYNPLGLARLGSASDDCGLISSSDSRLLGSNAKVAAFSANATRGGLHAVAQDARSADMNLSSEDQCF
ncbi:MAG: hypothetical protein H6624_05800 [Bdellovibrionaceae bacterium]|nr:hypothetical protein [Bdellovibrionales bacterium]MCB9083835.1 hypothetical protein [Pseudobdellovibrionaceae bacterium]